MSSYNKLQAVMEIFLKEIRESIQEILIPKNRPVMKVTFHSEVTVYIRYNDYGEYSYLTVFSPHPDDQFRFDNYDDKWPVETRPHHFHLRGLKEVRKSPMNGEPRHDIPILLEYIKRYSD